MNIGICGGTFDPFHRGHIDPILAVRDAMQWNRIIYIPAYKQPFKTDRDQVSGYHRFAMAVLATEEFGDMSVSPMELERGAVSYTVDTLEILRRLYPGDALDWIVGDDNLADLGKWKNLDRIFELARFVVLTRDGATVPIEGRAIVLARNATVPVSSTEVRKRARAGEPIDDLVHPRVARYIHHYRLYQEVQT